MAFSIIAQSLTILPHPSVANKITNNLNLVLCSYIAKVIEAFSKFKLQNYGKNYPEFKENKKCLRFLLKALAFDFLNYGQMFLNSYSKHQNKVFTWLLPTTVLLILIAFEILKYNPSAMILKYKAGFLNMLINNQKIKEILQLQDDRSLKHMLYPSKTVISPDFQETKDKNINQNDLENIVSTLLIFE